MSLVRRFRSDQRGAVAIMFGFLVLPILAMVGGAVDYSRAAGESTKLQRAVDALALALTTEPKTTSAAALQARADRLFATLYPVPGYVKLNSLAATRTGKVIEVSTAATVQNAFMTVFGYAGTAVGASTKARYGAKIEVALVLDNTGSMNDLIGGKRKIDELKTAAENLLTDLRALADEPDNVKVSIVPFDTEVRLDAGTYRDKDWFRWFNPTDRLSWTGYVHGRWNGFAVSDAPPVLANIDSLFPAPKQSGHRTNPTLMALSTGDLAPMRPLASLYDRANYDALVATVRGMTPRGYTNIALGAMWGLATLSPSEPFAEAAPSSPEVRKYMLILTDGDNTKSFVNGALQSNTSLIDDATRTACGQIKAAKVELFTIRLLSGDAALLRSCATDAAHYFDVQNATDLKTAFQTFLDAIKGTRLTQ